MAEETPAPAAAKAKKNPLLPAIIATYVFAVLGAAALVEKVIVEGLPDGPLSAACTPGAGAEGLGWSESPRGTILYAVHLDADGRLMRVKIKSPSFANWRVFPSTVHDSNMMDYAINEASFGLTISGCAR